jgi:hypothetical protein
LQPVVVESKSCAWKAGEDASAVQSGESAIKAM